LKGVWGRACCGLQACMERSAYARTAGTLAAGPLIISSACASPARHVRAAPLRWGPFARVRVSQTLSLPPPCTRTASVARAVRPCHAHTGAAALEQRAHERRALRARTAPSKP